MIRTTNWRIAAALLMFGLAACGSHAVVNSDTGPSTSSAASPASNPILGTWRGTSICTPVRPACHDEIAVYHVAASMKPDTVEMTMNKVVDGVETEMGGTVEYQVDYASRTMTWGTEARDGSRLLFRFTWSGNDMTGTLTQHPNGEVVRNITLRKD
jgi:hypothetical protein